MKIVLFISRSKPLRFDPLTTKNRECNHVICSLSRYQHFLKMPFKSIRNVSSDFGKSRTGKCQLSHNLLGRGNGMSCFHSWNNCHISLKINFAIDEIAHYSQGWSRLYRHTTCCKSKLITHFQTKYPRVLRSAEKNARRSDYCTNRVANKFACQN